MCAKTNVVFRCSDCQIEQVLAVAGDDVGVVYEDNDAECAGPLDQREHARIGDVELLGMRVKLEHLDTQAGNPRELVQSGWPSYGWTVAMGSSFGCFDASAISASFCTRVCATSP
jgi:hypothetical protein